MPGTLVAQAAKVTPLFSKDLTNLPGKKGLMVIVEYPPGSSDPIHRHNVYGFIYVPEGSIVMQVRGGKDPREIEGKQALFVLNLAPRKMAGMVSEGMLFDIGYSDGITPVLAIPEAHVPDGSRAG